MSRVALPRRYIVNRLNWHAVRAPRGGGGGDFLRLVGALPVASFGTRVEAEAERARLEQAARERVNPFATGPAPHGQTSLPAYALRDWFLDADLTPPEAGAAGSAWRTWWQSEARAWSADQWVKAWTVLDKVRFYEIEEVPAGRIVFLAAVADEHYLDAWYVGAEGAFRGRGSAERECARRNAEENKDERELVPQGPLVGGPFDPPGITASGEHRSDCCSFEQRPRLRVEPFGRPYYETFELEVVDRPRDLVHVVVRNVLLHDENGYTRNPMEGGPCCVFVRGFAAKAAAEKFCNQQEARAWDLLRPGQVPCFIPEEFPERLAEFGLAAPENLKPLPVRAEAFEKPLRSLLEWWDALGERGTPELKKRVWELLDVSVLEDFRCFFQVLTTPLED